MLKPYHEMVQVDVLPRCDYREAKDDNGKKIKDSLSELGHLQIYAP